MHELQHLRSTVQQEKHELQHLRSTVQQEKHELQLLRSTVQQEKHDLQLLRSTMEQEKQARDSEQTDDSSLREEARVCLADDTAELRRLKQDLLVQKRYENETLRRLQLDTAQAQGEGSSSRKSVIRFLYM